MSLLEHALGGIENVVRQGGIEGRGHKLLSLRASG
jgi:hypothetical protein